MKLFEYGLLAISLLAVVLSVQALRVRASDPELRCLRRAAVDVDLAARFYERDPGFQTAINYAESVVGLRQAERDRRTPDWRDRTTNLQATSAVHAAKRLVKTDSDRSRVERLEEWLESYGPELVAAK